MQPLKLKLKSSLTLHPVLFFLSIALVTIVTTNNPVYAASALAYGDKCSDTSKCSGNLACDVASNNGGMGYGYGVQWEAAKFPATEHHCVCPQPGEKGYGEKAGRDLCWGRGVPASLYNK
jgi:hypothetical protein